MPITDQLLSKVNQKFPEFFLLLSCSNKEIDCYFNFLNSKYLSFCENIFPTKKFFFFGGLVTNNFVWKNRSASALQSAFGVKKSSKYLPSKHVYSVFNFSLFFVNCNFIFKIDYKTANFKPIQISILGQILRLRLGLSFYIITFYTPQCGNFIVFLSLRFYVKSILAILEV